MENKPWYPESKYDTLMACFCAFLFGSESRKHRVELRRRLMNRLQEICKRDELFAHPAVQALVSRLHAISPHDTPRSAEVFYLSDETRLRRECTTFITRNRREGYVGDKYTFCYLFSDLYYTVVYMDDLPLTTVPFANHYEIRLVHQDNTRFHLLVPLVEANRPRFTAHRYHPMIPAPSLRRGEYTLVSGEKGEEKPLVPPCIRGYRMHWTRVYKPSGLFQIKAAHSWPSSEVYAYVWSEDDTGHMELLSCASARGKTGPRFLLGPQVVAIYLLEAESADSSFRGILIERNGGVLSAR